MSSHDLLKREFSPMEAKGLEPYIHILVPLGPDPDDEALSHYRIDVYELRRYLDKDRREWYKYVLTK